MRKFFVGGNWKCVRRVLVLVNATVASVTQLTQLLAAASLPGQDALEVLVAPPFPYIQQAKHALPSRFLVSAQNCYLQNGAFTGEVSAEMLRDLQVDWVILGHSERRLIFGEDAVLVARKVEAALAKGLKVVLCVGEQLSERQSGRLEEVLTSQLAPVFERVKPDQWASIVIAYEPVWAIGTGVVATIQEAQGAHEVVRKLLAHNVSADVASSTRILYGGSVKANNCRDLASMPDVDGFLVGGASLTSEFIAICESASAAVGKL